MINERLNQNNPQSKRDDRVCGISRGGCNNVPSKLVASAHKHEWLQEPKYRKANEPMINGLVI